MKKTILVAEDLPEAREIVLIYLQNNFPNYNIETFENGASLEKRLKQGVDGVCAVVTDNQMPSISRAKIIDRYAPKLKIPFILFYGGDESTGKYLARKYNNVSYILKPNVEGLMDTLK